MDYTEWTKTDYQDKIISLFCIFHNELQTNSHYLSTLSSLISLN